jgi:hypothetical protein
MTPEQIQDGWHQANISRVISEMLRWSITPDEVELAYQAAIMPAMVNQSQTPILPAQGYKVAGD